jgi:hypothetical protein
MLHSLYRAGMFAALFGLLFVPGAAWGQKERPRQVHDEAKLFSKDAIEQANKTIAKIKEKHHKDLYIETIAQGPDKADATTKWTKARFNEFGIDGIYVVISKEPSYARYFVGDNTRSSGYFTTGNIEKLEGILKGVLGKKKDDALIEIANYTLETMNEHARAKGTVGQPKQKAQPAPQQQAPAPKPQPVAHQDVHENTIPPWVGWVCLIVGVLFVVWIVFAIVRAMTGSMGGGGMGYGGGGYGGGGGGFLTGMLGGMFGAMAGMWLYNNMFGGHATYGANGAVNWGGGDQGTTGSGDAPYEADTGEGGTGGGVDGDDAAGGGGDDGGGDAGGGGGDWGGGGGGDAGGGGDGGGGWFGGGGDGGGGGGDWGGGGGGGDFGGGGGGGDW